MVAPRDLKRAAFRQIMAGQALSIVISVTWAGPDGGTFLCKVIKYNGRLCVVSYDCSFSGIFIFDPDLDEWNVVSNK